MTQSGPGKSFRKGLTIVELMQMFPTEDAAREWFERAIWHDGRKCPHCGSARTVTHNHVGENRPYRCQGCHQYFSVRIGTLLERSKVGFQKWAIAIHLHMTSLKGVSSMQLHRNIGVTQKTAWFMLQRIRKAFDDDDDPPFKGPVEVDETYMGGKHRNMSKSRRQTQTGRGAVGKTAGVCAKDRGTNRVSAEVVEATDKATVQGFVKENVDAASTLYTDEAAA